MSHYKKFHQFETSGWRLFFFFSAGAVVYVEMDAIISLWNWPTVQFVFNGLFMMMMFYIGYKFGIDTDCRPERRVG